MSYVDLWLIFDLSLSLSKSFCSGAQGMNSNHQVVMGAIEISMYHKSPVFLVWD